VGEDTATGVDIDPGRAAELIASGASLIDVRRDHEWEAGRISGARHIEMNDLAGESESISREAPVVFYCRTGSRSLLATAAFREAGWDAYNLEGGLTAWVETGHDIEPEGGEVADSRPIS
jgi:rhodanese-related sulfurtransferase